MSRIHLTLDSQCMNPGERVSGTVRVDELAQGECTIDLRLCWSTSGKGTTDDSMVSRELIPVSASLPVARFAMPVPSFPWSYSGVLVSVTWHVEARVAGHEEPEAKAEFVCAPGGKPIRRSGTP